MNVQLLSFTSADEEWKPAFTDISPTKVLLRKLVQVSDLTICLDKRNAVGQIEVCQEPILYRCTLEVRILRKYNVATAKTSSTTRIDIFTDAMYINVSSQQFPMAMRLLALVHALKKGDLKNKSDSDVSGEVTEPPEATGPTVSYLAWAWSMIPTIFPEEETFEENENIEGHYLCIGVYVGSLRVTLKFSEIIADPIVQNSRKCRYTPIVRLALNGIYAETTMAGRKWFNLNAGVSQAVIEPLGNLAASDYTETAFLMTNMTKSDNYLMDSLFDLSSIENLGKNKKFIINWETYMNEITEKTLLSRTPAIAFDMVHCVDIPDDITLGSELSDLEYSNFSEKSLTRAFISTMKLKYNAALLNVVDIVKELVSSYDYPPYAEEKIEASTGKLTPPSTDDYDALMTDIPKKVYELTLRNFVFELHPIDETRINVSKVRAALRQPPPHHKKTLPFLIARIDKIKAHNTSPIYPNRLVHTTCQLPNKPKELLNACYNTFKLEIDGIQLQISDQLGQLKLLKIPKIVIKCKIILQDQLWMEENRVKLEVSAKIDSISLGFNRPQQIIFLRLLDTFTTYKPNSIHQIGNSTARKHMYDTNLDVIIFKASSIKCTLYKFENAFCCAGKLSSFCGHLYRPIPQKDADPNAKKTNLEVLLFGTPRVGDILPEENFIEWTVQMPKNKENIVYPPIVFISVKESALIIDQSLSHFLDYDDKILQDKMEKEPTPVADVSTHHESETKSSRKSIVSEKQSKKIIPPEETIHVSSDKEERSGTKTTDTSNKAPNTAFISEILPFLNHMLINIELNQCHILIPTKCTMTTNPGCWISLDNVLQHDLTSLRLPSIECKSYNSVELKNIPSTFPITLPESAWTIDKKNFPWTFSFSELSGLTTNKDEKKTFLLPVKTNITVACEAKKENNKTLFALNLHIDTTPITFDISEEQIIFIQKSINSLILLSKLGTYSKIEIKPPIEPPKVMTALEEDSNIKEFLAMNTSSEISTEVASSIKDDVEDFSLSIWLQWTVTKCTINFLSSRIKPSKITIELEDFITSVDKQNVYFKLKSKIGTFSVQYYELKDYEWIANNDLKLSIRNQSDEGSSSDTFLDITMTIAETGNVFKKWGAKKGVRSLSNTLMEVVVTAQAIDIHLDLKRIAEFIPENFTKSNPKPEEEKEIVKNKSVSSVSDLPLLYFESKGIVLYMPIVTNKVGCNVLIFKIGHIKMSPNVENPLNRVPIRPDVYTKAAQMRILNTPGSKVEDRQYELVLSYISIVTSDWNEVQAFMKENSESFHNTNPAFEWNNQSKRPSLKFSEIFKNFVFSITYAPSMVFKTVLICGPSIELNCITDLIVELTTDQVILMNSIFSEVEHFQSLLSAQHLEKKNSIIQLNDVGTDCSLTKYATKDHAQQRTLKSKKSLNDLITVKTKYMSMLRINKAHREQNKKATTKKIPSDNVFTDSGIASIEKSQPYIELDTRTNHGFNSADLRQIPFEVSFVAGVFAFKLYHNIKKHDKDNENEPNGYLLPLISFTITQPSMLISQKMYDTLMQFSVFNLCVSFGQFGENSTSESNDFTEVLFETRQGHLDSAGIPPPLLFIKYKGNVFQHTEIECSFRRPTKIFFSHKTLEKILRLRIVLDEIFITSAKRSKKTVKPVQRGTTIRMIRNSLGNADRISIAMEQTNLECKHQKEYDIKLSVGKVRGSIEINDRPERLTFNCSIENLLLSTEKRIMLHPVSLITCGTLGQESWNRFPVISCKLHVNVIQVDIGPENILQLFRVQKIMTMSLDSFSKQWEGLDAVNITKSSENINQERLVLIEMPEARSKKTKNCSSGEIYQDDLRAGAFQFVETNTELTLPLPYQIQIIMKNNGIVCWRYPQPRSLTKLLVYPVPLETSTPVHIKCRVEYHSESHSSFLPYCEFFLSETDTQEVELPKKKITATIWRVVILQKLVSINGNFFEESTSSEEDEELQTLQIEKAKIEDLLENTRTEKDFKLHPKALVACMRIDSSFDPHDIPKMQAVLEIALLQINLQNHLKLEEAQNYELPPPVNHFKLSRDFINTQTFSSVAFSNIKLHQTLWTHRKYSFNAALNFSCKVLDYSYLNMLYLIEETNLKAIVDIYKTKDVNAIVDTIRLNVGPAIMQTLFVSEKLWQEALNEKSKKINVMSRFIICNCTHVSFQFGQDNSNELLLLKPNECSFYSFRSDHLEQKISFVFDEKNPIRSNPIDLENEGIQYLRIGKNVLVVKSQKLSSTQMCIFLKGQVEILSKSSEKFRLQYRCGSMEMQTDLPESGRISFFGNCGKQTEHFLRLKFNDSKRKGWSGEIPLTSKTMPWMVKIPSATNHEYISFWLRVIVENIQEQTSEDLQPKRILVIIWPLFAVRSMLTTDMEAIEVSTQTSYTLKGRGETRELQIAGAHETEHELVFSKDFISPHGENKSRALLSYKAIDWHKFFCMEEKYFKIENALEELEKITEVKWPCSQTEELHLSRIASAKDQTTPIFRYLTNNRFSCSLMLEILPWCLITNSTGNSIRITNLSDNENLIIDSNNISMVFVIEEAFTIDIGWGTHWISSCPIYMSEVSNGKGSKGEGISIPEIGSIFLQIFHSSIASKFILSSTNENGLRVLKLTSAYVITNLTKYDVDALPFALGENENTHRQIISELSSSLNFNVPKMNTLNNMKGVSIDQFYDIKGKNAKRNMSSSLKFFICLRLKGQTEISAPLLLNAPFNRKCFSIQNGVESIPLAACVIEKNSQIFLNIYNDNCPAVELTNNTDLTLFVAETKTLDSNKAVKITPEYDEKYFEWYEVLRPKSKLCYTPPEMYTTFPDIENCQCNLSLGLALINDNRKVFPKQSIRWSKPLQIGASSEKLLNIPLHGDVKVIVCDNHKVKKISIFYITQQMEFSVKDLRTRLLNPSNFECPDLTCEQTQNNNPILIEREYEPEHLVENTEYKICTDHIVRTGVANLNLFVTEINIGIFVDSKKKNYLKTEVFALYMNDLIFQFDGQNRSAELVISNLQIDNQLYSTGNYDFPVVLCPQTLYEGQDSTPTPLTLAKDIHSYKTKPLAHFRIQFHKDDYAIESVHCQISPIRSYIEDTYLNDLFDYLVECDPSSVIHVPEKNTENHRATPGFVVVPPDIIRQAMSLSEPLKLKSIKIDPISVMLSVHTCVRLYIALDHSPLDFSTYERQNIVTLPMRFGHTLGMHYLSGALFGAGWVVGSLEILGSPSGLARSVSTGLRDFVSMPVQGLLRGPWEFLIGITHGSASLLRNITAGTVNSVTKLAASVARNLDRLTLDNEHFQRTEALRRSRPQGFTEGFSQGMTGFGISLLGAVGGLARHPLEATTPVQVVTGVGKGIVGAFAKPISAAAELVALTGQGMLHTVGFNAMPQQRTQSFTKNTAIYPADCKLSWKLFPNVLATDQILFYYEATMISNDHLKRVVMCLTPSVLAVLDLERDELSEIIPVERIDVSLDENDKTLINVKVLNSDELDEESDSNFVNARILNFLRDSNDHLASTSTHSLEDLLPKLSTDKKYKLHWSFYMSEHLGSHLLKYIKLVKRNSNKLTQSVQ